MDRELSPDYIKKKRRTRIILLTITALLVIAVFGVFRLLLRPVINYSDIQIAKADKGEIEATLSAMGTILPEFEEVITSPVTSRIKQIFHNVGETVNPGVVILSLDKSADELQLGKMNEELASRLNQKQRLQLNMESTIIELQTNYEIQRLKTESFRTNYENEKYIKSLGGTTEEMVKQAELQSKIAQLEIDHLKQSIINKKASLQTELKDQEFKISIYRKEMEELRKRIEDSDVKAPGKGVITWVNDKIGSTVSYGSEVVKLANLTSFKVEGTVSEIYLPKLSIGGKIVLNINDSILSGKISAINPTVQNESVKFTVMLDRKDHPVLRSNQRTDVNIVTSNRKNIIRIPREGLVLKGSNPYLFVVKDGWAYRRMVSFGESSFYYIEVKEGILPGEEVIISDMEENMHHEKIKLKK